MRHIARVDKNQASIVEALRKVGARVLCLHQMGNGVADLAVYYPIKGLLFMEVKSKGGRLTPEEQDFYHQFQECMVVVFSVDDALKAIGVM
jgi:hypothetical protein